MAQVYIEDKKKSAATDEDAVMYADRKTVLLEAQRSLISLVQFWKLWCVCSSQTECDHPSMCCRSYSLLASPEDAEKLCIPAVHTKWPKVRSLYRLFYYPCAH